MTERSCQHLILDALPAHPSVTRCERHSGAGVAAWVWSTGPLPVRECLCDLADRFLVAGPDANTRWVLSADVVLGVPQTTMRAATRVASRFAGLPGAALVAVSAGRHGTVACVPGRMVDYAIVPVDPRVCAVCLYVWLVGGHRLAELAKPRIEITQLWTGDPQRWRGRPARVPRAVHRAQHRDPGPG